jgi:transposase
MGKRRKHINKHKGEYFSNLIRGIDLERLLIVSIDAAKYHQKALICNYFGDIIQDSFFFSTDLKGFNTLLDKMRASIENVNAVKVLVGIEATGHYYEDTVSLLQKDGFEVIIINPLTTHEERSASLNWCKTDDIDLSAIAYCVIHNKGTDSKLTSGIYAELQTLTRCRKSLVNHRSSIKIQIRTIMDSIWKEFQGYPEISDDKPSVIKVFSDLWGKAPRFFMRHYPLPHQILYLGYEGLKQLSKENNLKLRKETIKKLLHAASISNKKDESTLSSELMLLSLYLEQLDLYDKQIEELEHKIEGLAVETEAVLLLTCPKIATTTAAAFIAEIGPIDHYIHAGQLIKKGGTNAMVFQSGGGRGFYTKISKQGNKNLRAVIFTIGKNLSHGNPYFEDFYKRLKSKGKHTHAAYIAVGNKFLKVAFSMLKKGRPFMPPLWEGQSLTVTTSSSIKCVKHAEKAQETLQTILLSQGQKVS